MRQSEGFTRHVKAMHSILTRVVMFLLLSLAWHQMAALAAHAAEPALPKLRADTQEAFERYAKLVDTRNDAELRRGTDLLWRKSSRERAVISGYSCGFGGTK